MFKLVNGNSKKATVDMSHPCGDWCIICDNYYEHDMCTVCDGFWDPCFRNDAT